MAVGAVSTLPIKLKDYVGLATVPEAQGSGKQRISQKGENCLSIPVFSVVIWSTATECCFI